ncbi:unnamed protein product [Lactuca virosa]|uniref:ABC1 atypical kinase-like domain-containing protein n=1 Tax=Lactuca virosa TaxID=75947 RepID=A0AAU9PAX8_9ASTR|nr:unnamed protein product [Lactuca virosa]
MALLEEELGEPWQNIYSELTTSPIAAASLGQVYKGRLKENGDLVAVKVQRPYVLETVTVDLFIIRNLGLALRRFPQIFLDVVGLVDEWAARFFEELDYINEGENGTYFAEMMKKDLPQIVIPKTYTKYTSRKVLTTQWVDGEKLSQSTESDVGELVNVGVICYLKQERRNRRSWTARMDSETMNGSSGCTSFLNLMLVLIVTATQPEEEEGCIDDVTVRNLGKPVELAGQYYLDGADELFEYTSENVFVPLTVGGGIKDFTDANGSLEVASEYFRSGADKISIGSDAVYAAEEYLKTGVKTGKSSLEQISRVYGNQVWSKLN